jgi:hypothetical protein
MRSIAYALPALPGFAGSKTYAAWPVWRDSTTRPVKFHPLKPKQRGKLWHAARRFERSTRLPGRQDGALGRNGLLVLHALLYDFLNLKTGQLDPGYAKIAEKACISVRSVARGLAALRRFGVLHWQRRSREEADPRGGYRQVQETNAYGVLPVSQWVGFLRRSVEPPAPHPSTWGATPPLDPIAQALADRQAGDSPRAVLTRLADDPGDDLACALARLGRAIFGDDR